MDSRLGAGLVFAAAVSMAAIATPLARATPRIGAHDVATLFYIAKSDDRNRVDYGIRLDTSCQPVGTNPVFAYWRRFEPGQEPLGDLNFLDRTVYDVAGQRELAREAGGTWLEVTLRALPSRRLSVFVRRLGERCDGAAQLTIRGRDAVLDHVFVQLGGPGQIDHVLIRGEDRVSGDAISERVSER